MNKSVFSYLFLFVLLWLVGCGPVPLTPTETVEIAAASPVPTSTHTLSPSATPITTQTRSAAATITTPSATPTPIPTATRSDGLPTPLPAPVWAEGITPLLTLDHGEASWSPTSNEVLLAVCPPYRPSEIELPPAGTIYYAAAPDFTPLTPVFTDFYCPGLLSTSEGVDVTWSPDGQQAVFVGIGANNFSDWVQLDWGPATIWAWQQGQTTANTVVSEIDTIRIPRILTWINRETLLLSTYASGGNTYAGQLLNIYTGVISAYLYGQGNYFSPTSRYVGANTYVWHGHSCFYGFALDFAGTFCLWG
ncbi:MAG: hypothetical protein IPL78_05345 [Chloroflexi bacterium]|nr:hypothetical protein [Chloroflexota bacterium]